ncbi:MAG: TolC family protein [Bdellovibrionota bacterium]
MGLLNLSALAIAIVWSAQNVAFGQENPASVGLDQAKEFAAKNNYEIVALKQKLEAAASRRKSLNSAFMPKIGVTGGMELQSNSGENEVPIGYLYGNYNLFNGFRDNYNSNLADIERDKIAIELKKMEFIVGLEVEQYFHTYLFYKDLIALKYEAVELNEEHQKLVAKTKAAGIASQTDVMEFELKDSLLKSELFSLKQKQEEARINLKRLLGQEIGSKIEPVGNLQHQHLNGTIMEYLNSMKTQSPSVLLAAKNQSAAEISAKKARSGWMPSIDLQARAGYLPLDERTESCSVSGSSSQFLCENEEPGMTISLTATYEFFSGFSTTYSRSEKLAEYSAAEAELRSEILNSITNVETSYRRIKTIEARVDLEEDNVANGRKYYESVKKEYKRGFKNSADLSGAADGLFDAMERRKRFKFDFLIERIGLERGLGTPVSIEVIKEK